MILREEMAFQLRHCGFAVEIFETAVQLYRYLAVHPRTIAVLDIGLAGEDGLSICQYLRSHDNRVGIVFVTARGLRDDRLTGFAAGADAYLVKPVDMDELVLILKRLEDRFQPPISTHGSSEATHSEAGQRGVWRLDSGGNFLIAPNGVQVRLATAEIQLLRALMARPDDVCTHVELGGALELHPHEFDKHRIEVILSRLRAKILRTTGMQPPLHSKRGVGYSWLGGVEDDSVR